MVLVARFVMDVLSQHTRRSFVLLLEMILVTFPLSCIGSQPVGTAAVTAVPCILRSEKFIHDPVTASADELNAPSGADCWSAVMRSEAALSALIVAIRQGSIPAAKYLAPHVDSLDGGELEDAHRALGEFSMFHMTEFMNLARSGALTERDLRRSLVMLPLSLSDRPKSQLAELKKRRAEVEEVSDPALSHYREAALNAIDFGIEQRQRSMSSP